MFLNYWSQSVETKASFQLKEGAIFEKQLMQDKIVFNYKNAAPSIEICSFN
jgi:hypothetical protein